MTDQDITLSEVYRLVERVEKKVDENNEYAHAASHDLNNLIEVERIRVRLLEQKHETLVESVKLGDVTASEAVKRVDARIDAIYRNAAGLAVTISGFVTAIVSAFIKAVNWPFKN